MKHPHPKYKTTNIPWLPKMPEHWELVGLNKLFSDNKTKNKEGLENKVLSLSYGKIIEKKTEENYGLIPESYDTYQIVKPGYIILRLTDLQNDKRSLRVGYSKYSGIITSAYTGLIPNKVDSRYYYYYLHYLDLRKHFYSLGGGVRQSSDFNELKKQKFPLPPPAEQTAIANYLDAKTQLIDNFISKKQKMIELLKEQRQATIFKMVCKGIRPNAKLKSVTINWLKEIPFHWEVKKLKYFASFVARGSSPNYIEFSEYKVVNQATFSKSYWDESNIRYTELKSNEEARGLLKNKDILLASTGGGVLGKVYMYSSNNENYIADSHVTVIRDDNNRFLPEYFFFLLSTLYNWIEANLAQGSTNQIELQRDQLINAKFPLPPIHEQVEICDYIKLETNKINSLITRIEKEMELIKEYKQSLIAEAVTGVIKIS